MFIHTLGKVPNNWYLDIELCQGTSEQFALMESFILTFSFESVFDKIGKELHNIQELIFDATKPTIECAQLAWDAQMKDIVNFRTRTI